MSNQQKNVNTAPDSKQAKLANMKLYIRFLSKHKNTYQREWQALWLIAETHKKFSYVLADEQIKLNRDEINLRVATVPDKTKKVHSYEAPGKSFSKK